MVTDFEQASRDRKVNRLATAAHALVREGMAEQHNHSQLEILSALIETLRGEHGAARCNIAWKALVLRAEVNYPGASSGKPDTADQLIARLSEDLTMIRAEATRPSVDEILNRL